MIQFLLKVMNNWKTFFSNTFCFTHQPKKSSIFYDFYGKGSIFMNHLKTFT